MGVQDTWCLPHVGDLLKVGSPPGRSRSAQGLIRSLGCRRATPRPFVHPEVTSSPFQQLNTLLVSRPSGEEERSIVGRVAQVHTRASGEQLL